MCLHCHWVWEEPACKELGGTNCCVCYSIDSYNKTLGKHNMSKKYYIYLKATIINRVEF